MLHIPEDPVHPGRILFDDFLEDYGLAIGKVAADTGIATDDLSAIRDGKAGITAEIVLQLSRYFSNSPEFWLNLQRAYDLSLAQKNGDRSGSYPACSRGIALDHASLHPR